MRSAPQRAQQSLAEVLCSDVPGAKSLLALVRAGVASTKTLVQPKVRAILATHKDAAIEREVAELTANLPSLAEHEAQVAKLIEERRAGYARAKPSSERGMVVFLKRCGICHQLDGTGALIGPQLDGIGNRGLDRLLEDVLDPSRNVDVAFRTTVLEMEDGKVITGLVRREEGAQLVLADGEGKEFSVPKDQVADQLKSNLSPMPANVPDIVSEAEFYDLMALLLSKRGPAPKK
jgi:putative heme-binding domain-containing protein